MFGLGGVFVEVLKDVTFRVAPFGPTEAHRMIDEIRGRAVLDGARGAPPADIDALANYFNVIYFCCGKFRYHTNNRHQSISSFAKRSRSCRCANYTKLRQMIENVGIFELGKKPETG